MGHFKDAKIKSRWETAGILLGAAALLVLLPALFSDFWFDLNDDVLMKDLLSGIYTGVPEARNIQMLVPIGGLVALLYRLLPGISVYGLFLQAVQVAAAGYIGILAYRKCGRKLAPALFMLLVTAAYFYRHFVFYQYTLTVGLLGGAAAFAFLCMELPDPEEADYIGKFLKACLPPVLLCAFGFLIRTEMMLLMLPFALTGALFALVRQMGMKLVRAKTWIPVGLTFLLLFGLFGLGYGAEKAATASPEWREFTHFFDERTAVYDYERQGLLSYWQDKEFYDSVGMTESQAELLINYNFALDKDIDAALMEKVADHAAEVNAARMSKSQRLKNAVWDYRHSLFRADYRMYNAGILIGYLTCFVSALLMCIRGETDKTAVARRAAALLLLAAERSALWLYLCYGGRVPERLTHSLFLAEMILLMGLFLSDCRGKKRALAPLTVFLCVFFCLQFLSANVDDAIRREVNPAYEEYLSYCSEHPENFYFTDVYSTVQYSERLYGKTAHVGPAGGPRNEDLLGGWSVKSPLFAKKLAAFGHDDPAQLLLSERGYFAAEPGADVQFLTQWYEENRGTKVGVREVEQAGDAFVIYKVFPVDDTWRSQ